MNSPIQNLSSIAVVIPAKDEEDVIESTLRSIPGSPLIIVVNNGSTDKTAEIARQQGALVINESRPGYGRSVYAGILEAKRHGKAVAVILDADGSDDPSLIPDLVHPVLSGKADLCIAQRTQHAEPGSLTVAQNFGNWLSVNLIHLITGFRYSDMGPFRAILIEKLNLLEMEDPTFGWNIEMQIKAVRAGLKIQEFEFPYRCRQGGKSKISGDIKASIKAGSKILFTALKHIR